MKSNQISLYHLWSDTFGVLLVASFYSFPRSVVSNTYTAAPWAMLAAGVAVFLLLLPTVLTLSRRAGQNLIDLALECGGRPLAVGVALVINASIVLSAGLSLRQASELVVTALYPHTPQTFAMASMIGVSALGAAMAPANVFWIASLYVWPTLVSILILLIGSLGWGQFRNVMPLAGPGVLPVLGKVLLLTSHYSPVGHLIIFCGLLPSARRLSRGVLTTIAAASLTWSLVLLLYLMVFPLPGGMAFPFPLFEMSRLVQGGRSMDRFSAPHWPCWRGHGCSARPSACRTTGVRCCPWLSPPWR